MGDNKKIVIATLGIDEKTKKIEIINMKPADNNDINDVSNANDNANTNPEIIPPVEMKDKDIDSILENTEAKAQLNTPGNVKTAVGSIQTNLNNFTMPDVNIDFGNPDSINSLINECVTKLNAIAGQVKAQMDKTPGAKFLYNMFKGVIKITIKNVIKNTKIVDKVNVKLQSLIPGLKKKIQEDYDNKVKNADTSNPIEPVTGENVEPVIGENVATVTGENVATVTGENVAPVTGENTTNTSLAPKIEKPAILDDTFSISYDDSLTFSLNSKIKGELATITFDFDKFNFSANTNKLTQYLSGNEANNQNNVDSSPDNSLTVKPGEEMKNDTTTGETGEKGEKGVNNAVNIDDTTTGENNIEEKNDITTVENNPVNDKELVENNPVNDKELVENNAENNKELVENSKNNASSGGSRMKSKKTRKHHKKSTYKKKDNKSRKVRRRRTKKQIKTKQIKTKK